MLPSSETLAGAEEMLHEGVGSYRDHEPIGLSCKIKNRRFREKSIKREGKVDWFDYINS